MTVNITLWQSLKRLRIRFLTWLVGDIIQAIVVDNIIHPNCPNSPCNLKLGHDGPHMFGSTRWTGYDTMPLPKDYLSLCGPIRDRFGATCILPIDHYGDHMDQLDNLHPKV